MYYCKDLNCEDMIADAKAAIIEALTDGEYSDYYCCRRSSEKSRDDEELRPLASFLLSIDSSMCLETF